MRIGDWSADVCSSDLAARVGLAQHARRRARHAQGSARLCAAARLVRRASASVRMKELTHVEIATDGACKGNPGPGGWGAVIRAGTREKDLSGGAADTTNNRMELTAVIEALNALKRPCRVTLS